MKSIEEKIRFAIGEEVRVVEHYYFNQTTELVLETSKLIVICFKGVAYARDYGMGRKVISEIEVFDYMDSVFFAALFDNQIDPKSFYKVNFHSKVNNKIVGGLEIAFREVEII